MQEPKKIRLTDAPETKKVNLTPLPSLENKYPEGMADDIYFKQEYLEKSKNEDNQQNNP